VSAIAIVGASGTGKSTSYGRIPELNIQGLDPKTTVIINVANKDLPFKGWRNLYKGKISEKGNYLEASDASTIAKSIEYISTSRTDITNIVVDDSQFIMAFEFMRRAKEPGYNKFADLGVNMAKILEASRTCRPDLKIYFLWHPEVSSSGSMKMKTAGKMVDDYISLEGLFSVILYTNVSKGADNKMNYTFVTNNDGQYPAKSPVGMFNTLEIPNDLGFVSECIDAYNIGEVVPETTKIN
jgi:hypothetical protein